MQRGPYGSAVRMYDPWDTKLLEHNKTDPTGVAFLVERHETSDLRRVDVRRSCREAECPDQLLLLETAFETNHPLPHEPRRHHPDRNRFSMAGAPCNFDGMANGVAVVQIGADAPLSEVLRDNSGLHTDGTRDDLLKGCVDPVLPVKIHEFRITYEPGLAEGQIRQLRGFIGGLDKVLVSPVAGQGSPIIVTAWANQLELTDAGDARLAQFVDEFEGSLESPEPGGLCNGGVGTPTA